MSDDIGAILREWDEDPDSKSIRKIVGPDGKEKIQKNTGKYKNGEV